MVVSNTLNKLLGGLLFATMLALAGCAQNQPVEEPAPHATGIKQELKSDKAVAEMKAAEEVQSVRDYASMNPVSIDFEKLSVKLDDPDKEVLAKIKTRALKAKQLTITGYCDKRQVGNSKAAAIARATAVKQELVRLGVKPKAVRIKHVTDVANKHAVEIEL
jgi:outer membrane protein OmpA-like peptidoglycan-associated protein